MKHFAFMLILASNMALAAGLECYNAESELSIKYQPEDKVNVEHRGFAADGSVVSLAQFTGVLVTEGTPAPFPSLYRSSSYHLVGVTSDLENVEGKLTVVERPIVGRACGRGGCDSFSATKASLEYNGTVTKYDCEFTP